MLIVAKVEKPTILSHTRKGSNPQTAPLSKTASIAHHRQNFAIVREGGERLQKRQHKSASKCLRWEKGEKERQSVFPSLCLTDSSLSNGD